MSPFDIDLPAVDVMAVARLCARYPGSSYPDLLARAATRGANDAAGLRSRAHATADAGPHAMVEDAAVPADIARLKARLVAGCALVQAGLLPHGGGVDDVAQLLELAHRASGHRGLPPAFADLWLDSLFLTGDSSRFPYPREREVDSRHWRVTVDEMNPFLAESPAHGGGVRAQQRWLTELSRLFTQDGLSPLHLQGQAGLPLHAVAAPADAETGRGLVSVVMPAFDPTPGPPFALTSVLRQTHSDLEVLLCDDGSGHEGRVTLSRWAALDTRVRLLRSEDNRGAYAARNAGLAAAGGEFVTFQDIDDWSHPERLARQVATLRSTPEAMGTVSRMVRVDDQLGLTVLGYAAVGVNASSLLFRRAPVLGRLGGFDSVRRAGDNEFLGRLRAVFGSDALVERPEILALVRRTQGSLSRDDHRLLYRDPARAQYRACYRRWHEHISAGKEEPLIVPPARIPVPAGAHLTGARPPVTHREVVVLASPARNAPTSPNLAAELAALAETGRSVAVVDFPAPFDVSVPERPPAGELLDLVNASKLGWWSLDDRFRADLAVIRDPAAVTYLGHTLTPAAVGEAVLVADYTPHRHYDAAEVEDLLAQAGVSCVRWLPATAPIAADLAASVDPDRVMPPRLWGVAPPTAAEGSSLPRSPRVAVATPSARLATRDLLSWSAATVPADPQVQVWCRTRVGALAKRRPVHTPGPPRWSMEDFLSQVSHLLVPPIPGRGPHLHREAVSALQHGCVPVLDPTYRPHFGAAALYTDDGSCQDWVDLHSAKPETFVEQQQRARRLLGERLSVEALHSTLGTFER